MCIFVIIIEEYDTIIFKDTIDMQLDKKCYEYIASIESKIGHAANYFLLGFLIINHVI